MKSEEPYCRRTGDDHLLFDEPIGEGACVHRVRPGWGRCRRAEDAVHEAAEIAEINQASTESAALAGALAASGRGSGMGWCSTARSTGDTRRLISVVKPQFGAERDQGRALRAIARDVNTEQVPTARGGPGTRRPLVLSSTH